MSKYLGLDFGEKTIGIAISRNGRLATGLKTLHRKTPEALKPALKELKEIIRENQIETIILGNPKNLDNNDNPRTAETAAFAEKIRRYIKNITVTLWDERLSTQAVARAFSGKTKNYKKNVDTMAAVYILQGFLDYKNTKGETAMHDDDSELLIIFDESGNEIPLTILANKQDETGIYLLATKPNAQEVYIFECLASEDDEDEFDILQIDRTHPDFSHVAELFEDDFEEFDLDITDII